MGWISLVPKKGRLAMTNLVGRSLAGERGFAGAGFVSRVRLAIAAAVFIAAAHAQTVAGVVRGSIADQHGRHVPEVKVTLTNRETGVERGAASDSRGEFTIASVPPGEYRLEARRQGFLKYGQSLTMEVGEDPGLRAVNLSIVKNTALTERLNLQLRAEFFNALNRANYNLPDNFIGSPTFGQVVSAQDPRRVQFAFKLLY
jgi:hypothetical protein